ncbi:MAG: hypothetical protein K6F35_05290 [Lachnospiraceae bacterium]|nr:hypothetical protein [Lachnospiraceae bacterium]
MKGFLKKPRKGTYGYLKGMRYYTLLKALLLFFFAFAVLLTGKLRFPVYSKMFGITAIVICIPGAMAAVSFVMFCLHKPGSAEVYEECEQIRGEVPVFYDSVITTTEKGYSISVFACADGSLIGFAGAEGMDASLVEKHIRQMNEKNGLDGVGVKIFKDYSAFKARLLKLASGYPQKKEKDLSVLALIGNLSL